MVENVFRYHTIGETQRCPGCKRAIPIDKLTFGKHELLVQPARKGRAQTVADYSCALRSCGCGVRYAMVAASLEPLMGYSFQCRACEVFTGAVDGNSRCLGCTLEKKAGVKDARAMFESLEESKSTMGISRSEFLSGFLKGVILGVPGLIYEEHKE